MGLAICRSASVEVEATCSKYHWDISFATSCVCKLRSMRLRPDAFVAMPTFALCANSASFWFLAFWFARRKSGEHGLVKVHSANSLKNLSSQAKLYDGGGGTHMGSPTFSRPSTK